MEKLLIFLFTVDFFSQAVRPPLSQVLIPLENEKYGPNELLFNISCWNRGVVARSYKNCLSSQKRNKAVQSCYFLSECHNQLETSIVLWKFCATLFKCSIPNYWLNLWNIRLLIFNLAFTSPCCSFTSLATARYSLEGKTKTNKKNQPTNQPPKSPNQTKKPPTNK